jgi:membrane protease subunit HflC
MKNISVLIFVALIVAVLVLCLFTFQVRETEVAVITQFGKVVNSINIPGLYKRWPSPINVVHKFDSRGHLYTRRTDETSTKGGDPIIVTSYVIWKIGDARKFLEKVVDKTGAEEQLESLLGHVQNEVIGRHYFSDFVNSDKSKIKFAKIEEEMLAGLSSQAADNYGIEVKMVGIKQLGVSEKVSDEVFARMTVERQRWAAAILADGEAEATKIKSGADRIKNGLLAVVKGEAKAIRGAGDAEAAKYYKDLEADPELAMFLDNIEAWKTILKEKSTVILGADTEPMKLFKGVPDIKPKEQENK